MSMNGKASGLKSTAYHESDRAVAVAVNQARTHKAVSSTQRPTLIAPGDIDRLFDDHIINELAYLAKLPKEADLTRFAESVRQAARSFVHAKSALDPQQIRDEIKRL
jgi:hypothetical protein